VQQDVFGFADLADQQRFGERRFGDQGFGEQRRSDR
jgi:hypothetical protein